MAPISTPFSVTGDHRSQHWTGPAPHPNIVCRRGQFLYTPNKSHYKPYQVTGPPHLCRPCSTPVCLGSHAQGGTSSPFSLPLPPDLSLDRELFSDTESLGVGHSPSFLTLHRAATDSANFPCGVIKTPEISLCMPLWTDMCMSPGRNGSFLHAGAGDPKRSIFS